MRTQALLLGIGIASLVIGTVSLAQKQQPHSQAEKLFARAKTDDFIGEQGCANCHPDKVTNFKKSPHAAFMSDSKLPLDKKGCEGCHGPGGIHQAEQNPEVLSFTKMTPKEASAACLRCHEQTMSESHWKKTAHAAAGLTCVNCHQIHSDSPNDLDNKLAQKPDARTPAYVARVENANLMLKADERTLCGKCHQSQLSQFRLNSHHPIPEGRMQCTDCHNPHPDKNSRLSQRTNKDTCVTCHAEYAGPFVFEHDPVSGHAGNGCQECHQPHGSNNPELLNSFSRGVCGQCHTDKMSNHNPFQTCWAAGCHASPHGSNTSDKFFTP